MKLYFRYILILLKSQMQYRVSFWLLSAGQFFVPLSVFAGLYFLFERFGNIKGWSFFEVALCFSVVHMAFSISECFARGFDSFSSLVSSGEFDRVLMVISGVFIFAGIFILAATLCFWTIQGIEVANIFTDGGREMSQYPLNIYKKWVTRFFTFVIPFGCVNYFPLMYVLGKVKDNQILYMLSPLYGILFVIPCLCVWSFGVKHYKSTGS